jgi:CRP/FNR family nitrogen fixation transcriptional regulator
MNQNWPHVRASAAIWQHQRVSAPPTPPKLADAVAAVTPCCRGQMIYDEGTPVECWYRLVSGAARRFVVRADGRRQIIDLLLSGDIFGFGVRGSHAFTADVISSGAVIARYPRSRLEHLAASDPWVAHEVQEMALEETHRLQDLILILGRITAREKVGAFLLHLTKRLTGRPADHVTLPISRYDIADYLALSVETVSRALTDLKRSGVIALSGPRQLRIVDRDAIEATDAIWPIGEKPRTSVVAEVRLFDAVG